VQYLRHVIAGEQRSDVAPGIGDARRLDQQKRLVRNKASGGGHPSAELFFANLGEHGAKSAVRTVATISRSNAAMRTRVAVLLELNTCANLI
jgi:hypothetical protein